MLPKLTNVKADFDVLMGGELFELSIEDYRTYLKDTLVMVDHHDMVSIPASGPIVAANNAQLKELIAYLSAIDLER